MFGTQRGAAFRQGALGHTTLGQCAIRRSAFGQRVLRRRALGHTALGHIALGQGAFRQRALRCSAFGQALRCGAPGERVLRRGVLRRGALGQWALGRGVLGARALRGRAFGERVLPDSWTPLIILALSSQVLGQGLLVYALGHVPPLIVGLALLTQPAISAAIGWLAYGETFTGLDWTGAITVGIALVLVRLHDKRRQPTYQP